MSVILGVERLADVLEELKPLHRAHWEERADLRPVGDLSPDYERGIRLNDAGAYILCTARRDGRLIGYCSFYVDHNTWTGAREASAELLYLVPDERHGWLAVRLYEYAHHVLRHVGVKRVTANHDIRDRFVQLIVRAGYRPTNTVQYERYL